MNCDAARRRLLAAERPDRPPDEVRRHLAACPECRAWGRRLVLVEQQIPLLPIPASSAKDAFVRRFRRQGGPVVRRVPMPWPTPVKERGLRKLSLAVAIAAVLAVFTLGLWSWRPPDPTPNPAPVPMWVANVRKDRKQILALATPRERVERLSDLAADLQERARTLTDDGDAENLSSLAALYGEVVSGDLMEHARGLSADERPAVLGKVMDRLRGAESTFSRLASEHPGASTTRPLHDLAFAARDGGRRIREMMRDA
jgi:hypothetical protein